MTNYRVINENLAAMLDEGQGGMRACMAKATIRDLNQFITFHYESATGRIQKGSFACKSDVQLMAEPSTDTSLPQGRLHIRYELQQEPPRTRIVQVWTEPKDRNAKHTLDETVSVYNALYSRG